MKKSIVWSVSLFCASALFGVSVPQSPVITYGLIRDEYGVPLKTASEATLRLVQVAAQNGKSYGTSAVTDCFIPGVNYRLSLEIDSEGPARSYAVVSGTQMKILCTVGGEETTLSPEAVFSTPRAGTVQRLDFTIGTDADGDGLPDDWEIWALRNAGKAYDSVAIAAFDPSGDADGDGMTNRAEYLAGTDPFLATEMFEILSFEQMPDTDRVAIRFTTRTDRTYHIVFSEKLGAEAVWAPVPTSATVDGVPDYNKYTSKGRPLTVYALRTIEKASGFFRVVCD